MILVANESQSESVRIACEEVMEVTQTHHVGRKSCNIIPIQTKQQIQVMNKKLFCKRIILSQTAMMSLN